MAQIININDSQSNALSNAVRTASTYLTSQDVEINISGTIRLTNSINISNNKGHKLTFKGGTIDGSKVLSGSWSSIGNNLYTYTFNASEKPESLPVIYINDKEYEPAKKDLCTYSSVTVMNDYVITSTTGALSACASEKAQMWVTQQWSFTLSRYTIGDISGTQITLSDDSKRALTNYNPPSYHLTNKEGENKYLWYTAYNAKAFIQNDGDFSYNPATGVLTLKSSTNPSSRKIEIPAVDTIFDLRNAFNVHFQNVTFTKCAARNDVYNTWKAGQADEGVNQLRAKVKRPASININEANNISFTGCNFTKLFNTVVAMDNRVFNSKIINCIFSDIGGSCIRIGPEVTLDQLSRDNNPLANLSETATSIPSGIWQYPQNITIEQNLFSNIATNYKGSVGVLVQYGNNVKIDHNTFNKSAYSAISVGWGWHNRNSTQAITNKNGNVQVTNNYITNAMNETVDGAPIYHLGYAGNRDTISGNYINTNNAEGGFNGGIYLDEGTDNVLVTGNLVVDCMNWIDMRYLATKYSKIQYVEVKNNYTNTAVEGASGNLNRISITDATDFANNIKISSLDDSRAKTIINNAGRTGIDIPAIDPKPDNPTSYTVTINNYKTTSSVNSGIYEKGKALTITFTLTDSNYIIEGLTVSENGNTKTVGSNTYVINSLESNVIVTVNVREKNSSSTEPIEPVEEKFKVTLNNEKVNSNIISGAFSKGKKLTINAEVTDANHILENITVLENGQTKTIKNSTYTIASLSSDIMITPNIKSISSSSETVAPSESYKVIINNSYNKSESSTGNYPKGKKIVISVDVSNQEYKFEGMVVYENGRQKNIDDKVYTIESLSNDVVITTNVKKKETAITPSNPEIPTEPTKYTVTVNNNHTVSNINTGQYTEGEKLVVTLQVNDNDYIFENLTVVENGQTKIIESNTYTIEMLTNDVVITANVKRKDSQPSITGYGLIVNTVKEVTCNWTTGNYPKGRRMIIIFDGENIVGIEVKEDGQIKTVPGNTYTIESLNGVVEVTPIIK